MPSESDYIPLCVPEVRGNEWNYIKECLDTNWVSTAGPFVNRFEDALSAYINMPFAVATASGTAALHIALLVAGVEPNDEVLVPTLTFIAPVNAIRYVGAWPVFMDAEPTYWQMDISKVADFLEAECRTTHGVLRNKTTGRRIRGILPVHILGHPVDMDPLLALARRYELVVIEDATESLGAQYKGRMTGTIGDIACFSFNGNKIITTGGGGMLVTKRGDWATRARYLSTQAKDDEIEFVHNEIGFNYRLTNIQAAMGVAQLERLSEYVEKKRGIASAYAAAFGEVEGISTMLEAPYARSTFWMYTVLIDEKKREMDSRAILRRLAARQIQSRPLWQPVHLSPAHKGSTIYRCETAEFLNRVALSLPCSVGLKESEMHRVIETVVGH